MHHKHVILITHKGCQHVMLILIMSSCTVQFGTKVHYVAIMSTCEYYIHYASIKPI